MNVIQEKLQQLATLVLDHQATAAEQQELNELLAQYPELETEWLRIRQAYHFQSPVSPIPDADAAFEKHRQRLAMQPPPYVSPAQKQRNVYLRIAGRVLAATAAAACIFFIYNSSSHKPGSDIPEQHTVCVPHGVKKQVQLPDGTQVWLNADSKLSYNNDFGKGERLVWLTGEAFFDVKKDAGRPMKIHTSNMSITVLGTSFNVRSYGNEKTAETVLVSGMVEVSLQANPENRIRLIPGNKLVVRNTGLPEQGPANSTATLYQVKNMKPDSSGLFTEEMWTRPGLSFRGETLEGAVLRLEHWFNVHINIADAPLKQGIYTGDFKNETLQQVLDALQLSGNFSYAIQNDTVTIYKR